VTYAAWNKYNIHFEIQLIQQPLDIMSTHQNIKPLRGIKSLSKFELVSMLHKLYIFT